MHLLHNGNHFGIGDQFRHAHVLHNHFMEMPVVRFQIPRLYRPCATQVTFIPANEWLHVKKKEKGKQKQFVEFGCLRFFASVNSLMLSACGALDEASPAMLAYIRFFLCVISSMLSHRSVVGESFWA